MTETAKEGPPPILFKEVDEVMTYFEQEGDKQMRKEAESLGIEFVRLH